LATAPKFLDTMTALAKRGILAVCVSVALSSTDFVTAAQEKRYDSIRRRTIEDKTTARTTVTRQVHRWLQNFLPVDFSFSEDEQQQHQTIGTQRTAGGNSDIVTQIEPLLTNRIIGGRSVAADEYPFFVEWSRGCGGTLIHADLVLSAAHCYDPQSQQLSVFVGGVRSEQARERTIVAAFVHPQYDPATESYDFVILKLDREIRSSIPPVVLNTGGFMDPVDGDPLTVIGLGITDLANQETSVALLAGDVNYIDDCAAKSNYQPGIVQESIMFCAGVPSGHVDSCQGDSGGPILDANKRQVGVVSFGRGCAEPTYPGIYARVSAVSHWIEQMKCLSLANAPRDCVMIRIDIQYDQYPMENSWSLFDSDNNVIYRLKPGENQQSGRVPKTLIVKAGTYRLTVYDKVGDGICCLYGEGLISVYTGDSWVEQSGTFGTETSVGFTVNPSGDQTLRNVASYASATISLRLTIYYDNFPRETSWKLMNDDTGAVVAEVGTGSRAQPGKWTADYYNIRAGNYWFSISDSMHDGICCRSGNGYILVQKIDSAGAVMKNVTYIPGDFGEYYQADFLVA
jgi:trypsin